MIRRYRHFAISAHGRSTVRFAALAVVFALLAQSLGCTRAFYRKQADRDAYDIVSEHNLRSCSDLCDYTIDPHPASRFYDPFNPDRPPMPPDDPAAHELMNCVDGKKGYRKWGQNGYTPYVENPTWYAYLPADDDGALVVDADRAVKLALLHSPAYQRQLEELYLSALDVSFERFRFDAQFFAGESIFYTSDGRLRSGTGQPSSRLELSTFPPGPAGVRMQKLFPAGAEMVVGFANSLVWEFSGTNTLTTNTLLDFTLVQPLMRGGGRDRVMERLTLSERTLMANVRQMERYQQGFYVDVITGQDLVQGPSRAGGVFGGAGLQGFTGVGGGGFGRVAGQNAQGGGGGFAGGAGAGQAGGFFGLLQTQQNIRNQEANIAALRGSLAQLDAYFAAGRIDYFQVELARQALYNAQSQLLQAKTGYQTQLDNFKLRMGLPPQQPLRIQDNLLDDFNLLDPLLVSVQNDLARVREQVSGAMIELLPPQARNENRSRLSAQRPIATVRLAAAQDENDDDGLPFTERELSEQDAELDGVPTDHLPQELPLVDSIPNENAQPPETPEPALPQLEWNDALAARLERLALGLNRVEQLRRRMERESLPRARQDLERFEAAIPRRAADLERLRRRLSEQARGENAREHERAERSGDLSQEGWADDVESRFDDNFLDARRLDLLRRDLIAAMRRVETRIAQLGEKMAQLQQSLELLRQEGPELDPRELNRRLMRELVAEFSTALNDFTADALELSLVQARARVESITLAEVDVQPDAAVRVAAYMRPDWKNARASLVNAWRLIQFNANDLEAGLDVVFEGDIRNTGNNPLRFRSETGRLRTGLQFDAPLTRLAERNIYRQSLIEYQQAKRSYYTFRDNVARSLRETLRTIELHEINFELRRAAIHVAIAQVELTQLRLQEPPRPDVEQVFGATTARDLVSSLSDLLSVQNDFVSVWVNFEVERRVLDLNLGTMQLNAEGIWIDPGAFASQSLLETALPRLDLLEGGCEPEMFGDFDDLEELEPPPILPHGDDAPRGFKEREETAPEELPPGEAIERVHFETDEEGASNAAQPQEADDDFYRNTLRRK